MPLRSLYPEDDDEGIRATLRAAFNRLKELEEFCSVRDELYCSTVEGGSEPAVWSSWPRLRRLALYNPDVSSAEFMDGLQRCQNLTHLVLTRADGLREPLPYDPSNIRQLPPLKRVVIINSDGTDQSNIALQLPLGHRGFLSQLWLSRQVRTAESVNEATESEPLFVYHSVPVPPDRSGDDIELCQDWVREHVLDGTLWDVSGIPFPAIET
ncbi:hypothetical protein Asppvi_009928 [Aspergillus pseudoviridinutans]|uniref:Uncharacterized protein n=1 Tax=Aspergillus pseudoviridinutans TaxID=1517512 RepID=A0A9P3BMA7_9EURO|nr:uncharacterized protein Asppvi_009928 [Aspergillus pseudoviridinutans]GIJ90963.1 hypothetical protein Asppvi_009928 [Aspergillus pseudoviridinutans]